MNVWQSIFVRKRRHEKARVSRRVSLFPRLRIATPAHWKSAGRPSTADVTLGKLVSNKKLKRTTLLGERGSRYTLN